VPPQTPHDVYFNAIPIEVNCATHSFDLYQFEMSRVDGDEALDFETAFRVSDGLTSVSRSLLSRHLQDASLARLFNRGLLSEKLQNAPPRQETKGTLSDIEINVSQTCNLGCNYCCVGQGEFGKPPTRLSSSTASTAIDQLVERSGAKEHTITFFGGEPLLNFPVVRACVKHTKHLEKEHNRTFRFRILTNGTAFTTENVSFIKSHNIALQISIDGSRESHNRWRIFRGGGATYDKIVTAIGDYFSDYLDKVTIRATMARGNLNALVAYKEIRSLGFNNIIVAHANGSNQASSYSHDELTELRDGYTQLARYFLEEAILTRSIRAIGPPFNEHMRVIAQGKRKESYCGAGVHFVGLSARGEYAYCQDLAENALAGAGDIISGLNEQAIKHYLSESSGVDKRPVCSTCWAKYVCGGGCAALAFIENGDVARPYTPDCEMIRHNIGLAARIISELQHSCPTAFFDWLPANFHDQLMHT